MDKQSITLTVNGAQHRVRGRAAQAAVAMRCARTAGLTGTHVGCEHGVCGACTVLVDGRPVRSCLTYADADGRPRDHDHRGASGAHGALSPLQQALHETHGLQCGFCTPGIVMTFRPSSKRTRTRREEQIRDALSGNLCRCTGYQNIVSAIQLAARRMREGGRRR